jgi:hypothetical protein
VEEVGQAGTVLFMGEVEEGGGARWEILFHVIQEPLQDISVDVAKKFRVGEEFEVVHVELFVLVLWKVTGRGVQESLGTILRV